MDEQRIIELIEQALDKRFGRSRFTLSTLMQILDGRNIQTGRATGTMIGTAPDQKISFLGNAPVAQQSAISAPSGGSTVDTQSRTAISSIISVLHAFGFTA